jgi:hypothetical protein
MTDRPIQKQIGTIRWFQPVTESFDNSNRPTCERSSVMLRITPVSGQIRIVVRWLAFPL